MSSCQFPIAQGEDLIITGVLQQSDSTPIDITDYTITSQVYDKVGGSMLDAFDCTIVDGPTGAYKLVLSAAQTLNLPVTKFQSSLPFDIKYVDGSGVILKSELHYILIRAVVTP